MHSKTVSAMFLTLLLFGILVPAFNIQPVKAIGTIYIRADGSIDPPDAPISTVDNVTYTFTDDIFDEIVVERDSIVVDGNGYTLHGTGTGSGFDLSIVSGVTVKNTHITNFAYGTFVYYSGGPPPTGAMPVSNTIANNIITNCSMCAISIFMWDSTWTIHGHRIIGNTIRNNTYGVALEGNTRYNNVYHNSFLNNTRHAHDGTDQSNWWNDDYPSGGNYWSDYAGVDLFSGLHQNETGSDGIGDKPYVISENNIDHYPLMKPRNLEFLETDLNKDLKVDILDISIVARAFGSKPGDSNWNETADLNKDGIINILDISLVARDYGKAV